jgi:glycerol-1-phosphate dehydrogenase [NAD(P)+]
MDTITSLVNGTYVDPTSDDQAKLSVPTRSVVIADSLAGKEADLVAALHLEPPFAVVSDPDTHAVLGKRIEQAISSLGPVIKVMLGKNPHADMDTAEALITETRDAKTLIAVGSGTINDLCKYTAARQNQGCAVFATAPSMNGYTSVNSAITEHGHKKSLPALAPEGVFMDLEVLAAAPKRMIQSGLGDSICRATAQVDWLLSHLLFDTEYHELPFRLLAEDEKLLLANPEALVSGDLESMDRLARTLILSGMGMTLCGGSYPASQGEHLISHYVEMMHPSDWQEAFHGEQIAVTACVMARLQGKLLSGPPPRVSPTTVTQESVLSHFGNEIGNACWEEFDRKRLSEADAECLNARIDLGWTDFREQLMAQMIAPDVMVDILQRAEAPYHFSEINLDKNFFLDAIAHAREIRNRYTFLDLAADAGMMNPQELV